MTALSPLSLSLALSAIRSGIETVRNGQTEAGLRLVEHGADYLEPFLPKMSPRVEREVEVAAGNLKRRVGV